MRETVKYYTFQRSEWRSFYRNGQPPLTEAELEEIKSLNDRISLQDVQDIYLPLTHLINIFIKEYESLQLSKGLFMQHYLGRPPFIIGISGSVAVGKSTTARLLKMMLARAFKHQRVYMVTTDGFLYPNAILEKKGIMDRKGFPESYNMDRLLSFLQEVKSGQNIINLPVYSHDIYDIVPGESESLYEPDILIVEGINTLQEPMNEQIYTSDFFDFSIYVDADEELIEEWYIERFLALLDTAFQDPDNFYYDYAIGPRTEAIAFAKQVWRDINLVNLHDYILPTRHNADVILHKTTDHKIDEILLSKY